MKMKSKPMKTDKIIKGIMMHQQTLFKPSNEIIQTQYGLASYYYWLQKEKDRIEKDPTRCCVIIVNRNNSALYVNCV